LTPTICTTYAIPDVIHAIGTSTFDSLDKASRIFFYYRGGADVVCIKRDSENLFSVFNPPFNTRAVNTVVDEVRNNSDAIVQDMNEMKIPMNTWFLFDIFTKKCLNVESFMDYIPYSGIKRALCIFETGGVRENKIWFLGDQSPYGTLQLLMKVIAKRELVAPTQSTWSTPGKKLLAFLVSHRFYLQNSFAYESGAWDSVTVTGEFTPADKLPLKLDKLNTTRAVELAASIVKSPPLLPSPEDANLDNDETVEDDDILWRQWKGEYPFASDKEGILLSEVLQVGVESFYNSAYTQTFNVEIDLMGDTFKEIVIDPIAKICMVCLNPGTEFSIERLSEDFQTDTVVIMEG
jgi:hypothetical protein